MNLSSFHTFLTIWFGQFVSRVGTAMTRFALLIWAYDQTGEATTVALLGFFSFLPYVLVSPVAGVWVDRLGRSSLTFGLRVMPLDEDVDFATGERVVVRVDAETKRPVPWTDSFREQLLPFTREVADAV